MNIRLVSVVRLVFNIIVVRLIFTNQMINGYSTDSKMNCLVSIFWPCGVHYIQMSIPFPQRYIHPTRERTVRGTDVSRRDLWSVADATVGTSHYAHVLIKTLLSLATMYAQHGEPVFQTQ